MSNHDHLSNIGLHPAYDPDPAVHTPIRVEALRKRIRDAATAVESYVGLQGQTVTITIGRNVADGLGGQGPMPIGVWERFRDIIRLNLSRLLEPEFSGEYIGVGVWQGVEEESCTFVASGVTTSTTSETLRIVCRDQARSFGQDAIALTIGTTELVES